MLTALLTNLDIVSLVSDVAHAIHNDLESFVIAHVGWGSRSLVELFQGWFCRFIIFIEQCQEVLVVSDGGNKTRFSSPRRRDPILESFKTSLYSNVPGALCIILDVRRGLRLEEFEGQLGHFTANNNLSQVRNLFHDTLKFFRSFAEHFFLDVCSMLLNITFNQFYEFVLIVLGLLGSFRGATGFPILLAVIFAGWSKARSHRIGVGQREEINRGLSDTS